MRLLAICLGALAAFAPPSLAQDAPPWPPRLGVAAFGNVDPIANAGSLVAMGFDYVEPALSKLAALPPAELDAARTRLQTAGITVAAMNWFLPSDLKVCGPEVDATKVRQYVERALGIASSFGARVIVFGSPGSRSVPADFSAERTRNQLVEFLRICDDVIQAGSLPLVIGLEPLRQAETNVVNTLAEALDIVRDVARPSARITCDFYHLAAENDDPRAVAAAVPWIAHLQLAEPAARGFPSGAGDDARYAPWLTALRDGGYRGGLSIEANAADLAADGPRALEFLRAATAEPKLASSPAAPRVFATQAGAKVTITVAGAPFATVHAAALPRPFVGPLLAAGGVPVTRAFPATTATAQSTDHPHHCAVWFAHGDVNGYDFWHGRNRRERIALDGAPELLAGGDHASVRCRYRWLVDDGTQVCREDRELIFAERDGMRSLDVTVTLHADPGPLVLGDTKEGTFAVRLHDALRADGKFGAATLTNADTQTGNAVWGKRSRWIAASGTVAGQVVGLAMFDHPQNHTHPTWWHARSYGLLAANPFGVHDFEKKPAGTGTLTLAPGKSLTLRWRVLVHPAALDAAGIDAAWREFAGQTDSGTTKPSR